MIQALLYLRLVSLRNLLVQRVRRLREPKYLAGTAVAVAYFYFFLGRRLGMASSGMRGVPAQSGGFIVASICVLLAALALLRVAYAWVWPPEKPGLRFSEAEIAFLFPAPFTRRTLVHFRLLSSQMAILFTAVLMASFLTPFATFAGSRVFRAVGWWVILSTFDLHLTATNLTVGRLREHGARLAAWRIAVVGGIVFYAVAVAVAANAAAGDLSPATSPFGGAGLDQAVGRMRDSGLLRALTLPFAIVFGPYVSRSPGQFAVAMVPALALLALNYFWVTRTEVSFEEGSIALAEKRSAAKAAAARGEVPKLGKAAPRPQSGPFPLATSGPPEVAFLWKNLLSMRSSLFSRRALLIIAFASVWLVVTLGNILSSHARGGRAEVVAPLVAILCAMAGAYTVILGPQLARQDLRSDLPNADVLKAYPIEGWRLALGELLAPTAILTCILWLAIAAAAAALGSVAGADWLTPPLRLTAAACLALAAPFLCLIQLIVPNTIMVLLPAWYRASRNRGAGIEMFGQRLIFGIVQLLFAVLVIGPVAVLEALIVFSTQWVLGPSAAVALATLVVVSILVAEAAVGLWWLGERFERFDLSTESR